MTYPGSLPVALRQAIGHELRSDSRHPLFELREHDLPGRLPQMGSK
jgi:hypothetical protein